MRKLLLLAFLVSVCSLQAQTHTESSCFAAVQNFYKSYGTPNHDWSTLIYKKPNLFAPVLLTALRADYEATVKNPGYIVGLDGDPFLNTNGDAPSLTVKAAHMHSGHCFVDIDASGPDKKGLYITPELQWIGNAWAFVNLHYPADGSLAAWDLLSNLKTLKQDRDRDPEVKK